MRTYVSRLRRALRDGAGADELIATRPPGYALPLESDAVDAGRFERLAADGRRALREGKPGPAAERLAGALGLWRRDAYAEFADVPALAAEGSRLERLRLTAMEDRVEADLAVGLGAELIAELETLIGRHPGHERLWGQLMTALYRAGRQADALSTYQRARAALVEVSGLEPSPALQAVQLSLEQWALERAGLLEEEPYRRGHRMNILAHAVQPFEGQLKPRVLDRLKKALSVIYGIEPHIVLKDIWGVGDREVEAIALWMADALVSAALKEADTPPAAKSRPQAVASKAGR